MDWSGSGILCNVRAHGETGAIVRLLTADEGLLSGYVRGGQSKRMRPILMPGNVVRGAWHARVADQLGHLTLELELSRAPLIFQDRLRAAGLAWITTCITHALPERIRYPLIHEGVSALLEAVTHASHATEWLAALVKTEALILAELGFGMDLQSCVATGEIADLAYVSPRSAQAVSRGAGAPYQTKLLNLPAFLIGGANASWSDIADGLALTGFFLERQLFQDRARAAYEVRHTLAAAVAHAALKSVDNRNSE
jgi:DNA repair protein RecO (recombination protein O)